MATIIHKSELVQRAITYLEERMAENPEAGKMDLLDEACMRFNLGPADAIALERLFSENVFKKQTL